MRKIYNYESSLIDIILKYVITKNKFKSGSVLVLNPDETSNNKLTEFRNSEFDSFDSYFKTKNNLINQLYYSYFVKIIKVELIYDKNMNYYKYYYLSYVTGYHYAPEYSGEYFLIESIKTDYNNYCFEKQLDFLNKWEEIEFYTALDATSKRIKHNNYYTN